MEKTQYSLKQKVIAWMLTFCFMVTMIPELAFASDNKSEKSEEKAAAQPVKTEADVTEEDVIGKTEDSTTYDLGGGEK